MATPELKFAEKYDTKHARSYYEKHNHGLGRRLSNWREQAIARRALQLAGDPHSVLDIPCGTGRFWETLAEKPGRKIYAADLNQPMIDTGLQFRPAAVTQRIEAFQSSAFQIPKPDNFVECVFCIRLIHHLGEPADRVALLKELARVASRTVLISLWIDGNYRGWRWRQKQARRGERPYQNRFLVPRQVIEPEFQAAGLKLAGRVDFLKFYSMWAIYVLRK